MSPRRIAADNDCNNAGSSTKSPRARLSRAYYFIGVLRDAFTGVIIINANESRASGRHLEEWPLLRAQRGHASVTVSACSLVILWR